MTTGNTMNLLQKLFLEDQFFTLSLMATSQRAHLYKPESHETERKAFHGALQKKLRDLEKKYRRAVPEDEHIANINGLSDDLSREHAGVLREGRFRIGPAQKALNMYIKYLWCAGWIPEPPHCPFDAIILARILPCRDVRWTQLDSIEKYKEIVRQARTVAAEKSLPVWELELYNDVMITHGEDRIV